MNVKRLYEKSIEVLKEEGITELIKKTKRYIKQSISKTKEIPSCKDVLFINGCFLPHPFRYRVLHQIEQLNANNFSCDVENYDSVTIDLVKKYRAIILYRCPITDEIEKIINYAKECNKIVFYDVDDLVIDTKYTDQIDFVKNMSKEDYELYSDGVKRMGETLKKCDYAITTTEALAKELKKYVKEVFVNRNTASEKMVELSDSAIKNVIRDKNKIILGYFSGSITHNPDFKMIIPALKKIFKKYDNVYLKVVGILDIPEELKEYSDRLIIEKFVDYHKLPQLISTVDINLAPIENTLFNKCKSENKWLEASLVKVPTLASNVGAFTTAIRNNETGFLCNNDKWFENLDELIQNQELRDKVANQAYNYTRKKYVSTYNGLPLKEFIQSKLNPAVAFVLPTTNISGGINVILKHASILRNNGYDVFLINSDVSEKDIYFEDKKFGVISLALTIINCNFDNLVGSLWTTLDYVTKYPKAIKKSYLVQGFETNFMRFGDYRKQIANSTYSLNNINYITVSKWCLKWLEEDYHQKVKFAPNGLNLQKFQKKERTFEGKIRILIEGNCNDYFKNVDESFKIVEKLDKEKYDITYLSYQGEPKKWYIYDRFMHKVPYEKVSKVYQNADILIKSSIFESFSYPPLEMMATGGIAVVAPNDGNIEYLKDNENCMLYKQGNIDDAISKIEAIRTDKKLREKLIKGGLKTALSRDWQKIEKEIVKLYE